MKSFVKLLVISILAGALFMSLFLNPSTVHAFYSPMLYGSSSTNFGYLPGGGINPFVGSSLYGGSLLGGSLYGGLYGGYGGSLLGGSLYGGLYGSSLMGGSLYGSSLLGGLYGGDGSLLGGSLYGGLYGGYGGSLLGGSLYGSSLIGGLYGGGSSLLGMGLYGSSNPYSQIMQAYNYLSYCLQFYEIARQTPFYYMQDQTADYIGANLYNYAIHLDVTPQEAILYYIQKNILSPQS